MNDLTQPDPLQADSTQRKDAPANDEQQPRREAPLRPLPEDAVIILPVRNVVLFPGIVIPLAIGRDRSQAAVQEAVRLQRPVGILLQNKPDVDDPKPEDLRWVGTTAGVLRYITTDGSHHAILKGLQRFRVLQFLEGYPFAVARVRMIEGRGTGDPEG